MFAKVALVAVFAVEGAIFAVGVVCGAHSPFLDACTSLEVNSFEVYHLETASLSHQRLV